MKENRNISIDILKCLAAIIITNSHMDILYPCCKALATGGAIGDALFFFCSGFTLFLGRMGRFDNWYKRRSTVSTLQYLHGPSSGHSFFKMTMV